MFRTAPFGRVFAVLLAGPLACGAASGREDAFDPDAAFGHEVPGFAPEPAFVPAEPGFASVGEFEPTVRASFPPPAPTPTGDAWEDEVAALKRRLAELESAEGSRSDAEAARKEAEAKRPTVKWTGQLQADYYTFDQDEESREEFGDIENGEAFRRARLGAYGDYGPTEYRIEVDFALSGRPSFLDVWAGLKDVPYLGRVRAGHFFEPFSLERLTPNRFVTFMERALPDAAFVPARNMGVMAMNTYGDCDGTWALGLFRTDSDVFGDDVGDEFESSVTGRVTYLPYFDEACDGRRYVHVGFGYSARDTNNDQFQFKAQPEARIGAASPNVPNFLDTGSIPADWYQLVGFEAAWTNGPFSTHGEYILTPVDAAEGPLLFHGAYAEASYFLTGEHRPYRREFGTFDRVVPRREFLRYDGDPKDRCVSLGPGAWQVAARVSAADLNDGSVRGGRLYDTTLGLNWYLNPYLRVTGNWVRAVADEAPGGGDGGVTDIVGMRVGYDF